MAPLNVFISAVFAAKPGLVRIGGRRKASRRHNPLERSPLGSSRVCEDEHLYLWNAASCVEVSDNECTTGDIVINAERTVQRWVGETDEGEKLSPRLPVRL